MAVQADPTTPAKSSESTFDQIRALLARPDAQRILEFKYRFAQAAIFGLPVLALQGFGHLLGGSSSESDRWIGILQAILSGWVTYVAAAGMAVEGLLLRGRLLVDSLIGAAAMGLYLYSAASVLGVFVKGAPFYHPLLFHWGVMLLTVWCGARWGWMRRSVR